MIQSQEAERKRIAAELHDGLGQNLLVIKNRALFGLLQPDDAPRAAEQLTDISTTVSQAIDEVRQIAANLHPYQLDRLGLTKALTAVVRKVGAAAQLDIACAVDDVDGLLAPAAETNLVSHRPGMSEQHRQACRRHGSQRAAAPRIPPLAPDDPRQWPRLRARVAPRPGASGKGGFGLIGISERALLLHGTLDD